MRTVYMSPDARSNELVVWSKAVGYTTEAELGGSALGLVALTEVARAQPGSIPVEDLQSLGRFIVSMQKPDGSFFHRYRAGAGPASGGESLYYPGEAALGLIDLHDSTTRNSGWMPPLKVYPTWPRADKARRIYPTTIGR